MKILVLVHTEIETETGTETEIESETLAPFEFHDTRSIRKVGSKKMFCKELEK